MPSLPCNTSWKYTHWDRTKRKFNHPAAGLHPAPVGGVVSYPDPRHSSRWITSPLQEGRCGRGRVEGRSRGRKGGVGVGGEE